MVQFIPPGQKVGLSNCERESLLLPGSIQPHGYLQAFDGKMRLTHAWANLLPELGAHATRACDPWSVPLDAGPFPALDPSIRAAAEGDSSS